MNISRIFCLWFLAMALPGCGSSDKEELEEEKGNFDPNHVLQVELTLAKSDWRALRNETRSITGELSGDCREGPFLGEYTWFSADVTIDGESLDNIGVRKKGFIGSQSTTKPGLKLNLDEFVEGVELFGVDNIVLNNAVQDDALIRQCLGYQLFTKAGLPASRCNFARVSVNGEDLGIYVHVEPVKPSFLRAHFGNDDGDLYEGTLTDFHPLWYKTIEPKTDETDESLTPVVRFVDDLADSSEPIEDVLDAHIHLDTFLTFLAMETWTGHWDGYGGNQNNFFIYRDSESDRFSFIPWGLDGVLDSRALEDSFIPTSGYIAIQILESPELSDRFYDRLGELLDTVFNEEEILAEIDRMEALLATEIDTSEIAAPIDDIRDYVNGRRENVRDAIPVTPEDFDYPFCMQEHGSIEASFETYWETEWKDLGDIMSTGELDMSITYDGDVIPLTQAGVVIGLPESEEGGDDEESEYVELLMLGEFNAGETMGYLLPYLYFPLEWAEEDVTLGIGWRVDGSLLYAGADTEYEFVDAGSLWEGELYLDEFDPTPGGRVTGSLSSGIYTWERVTE
jgi:hypothetical protein